MINESPELIAAAYSAAMNSVELINTLKAKPEMTEEEAYVSKKKPVIRGSGACMEGDALEVQDAMEVSSDPTEVGKG